MATSKNTPVFTAEAQNRILEKFLDAFEFALARSREGRELRDFIVGERSEILDDQALNEAQKVEELNSLTNRLVIEAGVLAHGRMVEAKSLWAAKLREWNASYEVSTKALADKYNQLWAPAPEDDHVVIGEDTVLRRTMSIHVQAMFAFTANKAIWAPYGRCASGCGRAIRPDRNGRLHKDCSVCYKASKEAKIVKPEDLLAAADDGGVTLVLANGQTNGNTHNKVAEQPKKKFEGDGNPKKSKGRPAASVPPSPAISGGSRVRLVDVVAALEAVDED